MLDQFRSLRFKLTSSYVLIFGLLQVILWVVVFVVLDQHLRTRFDEELLRRAQTVIGAIDMAERQNPTAIIQEQVSKAIEPFEADQVFIQVGVRSPATIVRSANLRGVNLPFDRPAGGSARGPRFKTLFGDSAAGLCGGEPLRLVTLDSDPSPTGPPYYVQVGMNLGMVERVGAHIQRLLVVFVVVSLLVAAMTSSIVARRSLAPLETISQELSPLSAASLDKRITVASNGDEVSALVEALNGMLERLQRQFKNEHDFISTVAHELKTPLAVLLGHVQEHRRLAHAAELNGFLVSAEEELWKMLRTVESSLILTRARGAQRLRVVAPVSMEEVIIASVRGCARDARKRDVKVVPTFDADCEGREPVVMGDLDLLTSMMGNLIGNAIRYSPAGQVVEVDARVSDREVQVSVRDRGPGIPDEHHSRIFEFCYQVYPTSQQAGKAGIGLAIVKAVVDLHGGTVTVRNRQAGGCEFTVRLLLANMFDAVAGSAVPA